MKRVNNLYERIYDLNNLYLAYYKASKGKKNKQSVIDFSNDLDRNLSDLQSQFIRRDVVFGDYYYFMITDPKERLICASPFSERVAQHAIINITEEYFENFQIFDSYACRKGKGVHRAVNRAFSMCKKYKYFLKLDVRKYFDSIDHVVLHRLLERRFKDIDLLSLFWAIIDSYKTSPGKGLPIGNLSSQYFANFYLAYFDRFIKQDLRVKDYVRYMDDFLLFSNSMDDLLNLLDSVKSFLNTHLLIDVKEPIINKVSDGFPFLGCRVYNNKILLSSRSRKRLKRKLVYYEKNYLDGFWDIDELVSHVNPLIEFTKISYSRNLRNYLINKYGSIF